MKAVLYIVTKNGMMSHHIDRDTPEELEEIAFKYHYIHGWRTLIWRFESDPPARIHIDDFKKLLNITYDLTPLIDRWN